MTQRVSRAGKKYTVGSTRAYGGWEVRVCCHCGMKLTHRTGGMYNYNGGDPWSTCIGSECIRKGRP